MPLQKTMSLDELRRRNEASQAAANAARQKPAEPKPKS